MNTPVYIQQHGTRKTKVSGAVMAELLRSLKIEEGGRIPGELTDTLTNIAKYDNPYGLPKKIKDDWVSGLGMSRDEEDTILYVGSLVPYEPSATEMAEALVEVLKAGNLAFGMLGSAERDSGAFARMLGEEGLFMDSVEQITGTFKKHKVKKIMCLSPHDYDTFLHYYEDIDAIEIEHYTQVLAEMIENGTLHLSKELPRRVTYHDPCYLGRQNSLYDEPRKILRSLPGLDLVEMKRSKEDGFCCGGGGTGLFLDLPRISIDRSRANQVNEVSPDCLAVACPICLQMLNAAMKSRNYAIEVKDIAQLVREAL
jgi:Fe-S oxidoreductase